MTLETFRRSRKCSPQKQTSLGSWVTTHLVPSFINLSHLYKLLIVFHSVLTEQVAGGIVVPGSNRLVACLGVDDLVIVDMPDALLVTTRARSQVRRSLYTRTLSLTPL